ncbi:MAG: ribosome maturation factor RimP [Gammaproteobacteria bacterium]|nr:ribosome maturation factor RimP [Gammaproteobacteria bacterium]
MRGDIQQLRKKLSSVVESMGYEWVGMEFHSSRSNALLRVYIDNEVGIALEDCQRVSHQLSGVLDVEDPIAGHYTLEISSPGLDRPLFEANHFERFAGSQARLQLHELLEGRRKLVGRLLGMHGKDVVIMDNEGRKWQVPLEQVVKARLVPEL